MDNTRLQSGRLGLVVQTRIDPQRGGPPASRESRQALLGTSGWFSGKDSAPAMQEALVQSLVRELRSLHTTHEESKQTNRHGHSIGIKYDILTQTRKNLEELVIQEGWSTVDGNCFRSSYIQPGTPDSHPPTQVCMKWRNPSGRRHLTSFLSSFSDSAQCPSGLISGSNPLQPEGRSRPQSWGMDRWVLSRIVQLQPGKGQYSTSFVKRFFYHYAIKDIIKENLEIMGKKERIL